MANRFLCSFIQIYMIVLFARALMSWFPISPQSPFAIVQRILFDLTEPIMAPVRRIIPPAGMFDLSLLVISFGLILLRNIVCI